MTETPNPTLQGLAETLLLTLYIRAMESRRPDALLKDEKAEALVEQLDYDFARIAQVRMDDGDRVTVILRNREFDQLTKNFLARFPQAVVVHFGCGLDARYERVDNGLVDWYDLDLPEVIGLRRKLLGGEEGRYHLLACSAFDPAWMDAASSDSHRPFFFLAEGVFMYCEQAQVRWLIRSLCARFPGAELVFDAFSPYLVRMNNLRMTLTKFGARYHWGLKRGKDIERWGEGISLLDEWFPFSRPEPRLESLRWMRHIPLFAKVMGIFHYRLGEATG